MLSQAGIRFIFSSLLFVGAAMVANMTAPRVSHAATLHGLCDITRPAYCDAGSEGDWCFSGTQWYSNCINTGAVM
jgi:hypothetical protein